MDDHDREIWVATLVQAWNRTGWLIHAWALMGEHDQSCAEEMLAAGLTALGLTDPFNRECFEAGPVLKTSWRCAVSAPADTGTISLEGATQHSGCCQRLSQPESVA